VDIYTGIFHPRIDLFIPWIALEGIEYHGTPADFSLSAGTDA